MSNILPSLIERFFTQRLVRQRNASLHTVAAYRDTFRLLLKFAHRRIGKQPSALSLSDLDANLVVAFLDHLADDRAASAATYNLRLTGIRGLCCTGQQTVAVRPFSLTVTGGGRTLDARVPASGSAL